MPGTNADGDIYKIFVELFSSGQWKVDNVKIHQP